MGFYDPQPSKSVGKSDVQNEVKYFIQMKQLYCYFQYCHAVTQGIHLMAQKVETLTPSIPSCPSPVKMDIH